MTRPALIVFAKLPRAGEVKTRLGRTVGMDEAAEVYKRFADHAFTLADDLISDGVSASVFYAAGASREEVRSWVGRPFTFVQQEGVTLGERMHRAFDVTFAQGATQAVIIGTDVPELDVETVRLAYARLSSHDVVLGPSSDGGYYLLGMNAPTKELFEDIEWSTNNVLSQTLDRINKLGYKYSVLPERSDVDTYDDLIQYLSRKKS